MTNRFVTASAHSAPPPLMFWVQRRRGYGFPPSFRPPGGQPRKQVKGGRWSVRKTINGKWRAWTIGKAKRWSGTFEHHSIAISWAVFVAHAYAVTPKFREDDRDASLRQFKIRFREIDRELSQPKP